MKLSPLLKKKNLVLGVTGGIAAYKAVELASSLVKSGAKVRVVMTEAAQCFVTPLTFEAITGQPVITELFQAEHFNHVDLAKQAEVIIVAPATADFIAKLSAGLADDALTTLVLAARGKVILAPSMNSWMFSHPATQRNLKTVQELGYRVVPPEVGWLACGEEGVGRLASLSTIMGTLVEELEKKAILKGRKLLVTAGPTREPLDSLRYLSNRSSGKMGYALAEEAVRLGAEVTLISGPTSLFPLQEVKLVKVETAQEMFEVVKKEFKKTEAVLMAAAVADWRLRKVRPGKLKKDEQKTLNLKLVANLDILKELGKLKKHQVLVGFAAEVENLEENSVKKLKEKKLDLIVGNLVQDGEPFGSDYNQVEIFYPNGQKEKLAKLSKRQVAVEILACLAQVFKSRQ